MDNIAQRALVLLSVLCRAFSLFRISNSFPHVVQRETMGSPASISARPNSKIFSTLQVMTRANHHSPNHAAAGQIACYLTWVTPATVSLSRLFALIGRARVAHEWTVSLFISFATYSQYNCSPHKWDQLCHSGNFAADDWRLGGLWDVEVRMD
jgi:hypothetical protein